MTIPEAVSYTHEIGKNTGFPGVFSAEEIAQLPSGNADQAFLENLMYALHVDIAGMTDEEFQKTMEIAIHGTHLEGKPITQLPSETDITKHPGVTFQTYMYEDYHGRTFNSALTRENDVVTGIVWQALAQATETAVEEGHI